MITTAPFLNYTPVSLTFGTSGLRGLVKDITDLEAYINVKAALRYCLAIGDIHAGSTVVVAGDLRPSTDRILRACAQAIVDSGALADLEATWGDAVALAGRLERARALAAGRGVQAERRA